MSFVCPGALDLSALLGCVADVVEGGNDDDDEGNMLPGFRNMSATLLLLLDFNVGSSSWSGGARRTPPPTLENWDCSLAVRISRQPWGPRAPSPTWWPVEEEFQGSNRGIFVVSLLPSRVVPACSGHDYW